MIIKKRKGTGKLKQLEILKENMSRTVFFYWSFNWIKVICYKITCPIILKIEKLKSLSLPSSYKEVNLDKQKQNPGLGLQ